MIRFDVELQGGLEGVLDQLTPQQMSRLLEAEARAHRNYLRMYTLNAPGAAVSKGGVGHPERLHRDTGQLADTIEIHEEHGGWAWGITPTADYAIYHDVEFTPGRGFRDVWRRSFAERGDAILDHLVREVAHVLGL